MSGAGRSTVGNALEDLGWYVVDNLPPQMLGPVADLFTQAKTPLPRLAVVIDVRGGEFFAELAQSMATMGGMRGMGSGMQHMRHGHHTN